MRFVIAIHGSSLRIYIGLYAALLIYKKCHPAVVKPYVSGWRDLPGISLIIWSVVIAGKRNESAFLFCKTKSMMAKTKSQWIIYRRNL
ncbi:hypothetical protein B0I21_107162 [Sphingobacterium paludis]|uniref:Uncharacterized protein n=1 Tax=Sphingobacterium paludis TaxID=1476465 RepID=A0A4R7CXK5_9SPHI|nr:hypothetical protein B0I21_107162 [Sphingobacterium paludis]